MSMSLLLVSFLAASDNANAPRVQAVEAANSLQACGTAGHALGTAQEGVALILLGFGAANFAGTQLAD